MRRGARGGWQREAHLPKLRHDPRPLGLAGGSKLQSFESQIGGAGSKEENVALAHRIIAMAGDPFELLSLGSDTPLRHGAASESELKKAYNMKMGG